MAEVFNAFESPVRGNNRRHYTARACGRELSNGMWEGWIEFVPIDGGVPLRTRRETTQPNRADLAYWARGLRLTYLEGALERALEPRSAPPQRIAERPLFDRPAPEPRADARAEAASVAPRAVLDPFAVYAEGDDVLRAQLMALSPAQLRNIVRAYNLSSDPGALERLGRPELAAIILDAVARRAR